MTFCDLSKRSPSGTETQNHLRILHVSQTYYPFIAGGGRPTKVRAIATKLARRGHAVTVLTTDIELEPNRTRLKTLEQGRWGRTSHDDAVEAIYLATQARFRFVTLNPSVLRFCIDRLRAYDVVHIYGLYDLIGPVVAFLCRRWSVPYVVEPIGMFRPITRAIWLKQRYNSIFGDTMLRRASCLVATADQERIELVEGGIPEGLIIVRRNGVELPESIPPRGIFREAWNVSPNAQIILFLGRLVSKKGAELLVAAFAQWRAGRSQPSILVLAGPDEGDGYLASLKSLVEQLGLQDVVLFTGPLFDEAKWAAYVDCDVFVLPSQNENFGNTAAEAIACGTPAIVSDRCGIAPLLEGRAGLVVPLQQEALRNGLAGLLDDTALHQLLQAGCADVTRGLGWDEPVAMMEAVYTRLIAERRRV